jgi:hypothetical protein
MEDVRVGLPVKEGAEAAFEGGADGFDLDGESMNERIEVQPRQTDRLHLFVADFLYFEEGFVYLRRIE